MASTTYPPSWKVTRSTGFMDSLVSTLSDMKSNQTLTDFTILVKGVKIPCHKVILAAVCPYFRAMFNAGMKEVKNEEVLLDVFDGHIVKDIVEYMYSGDIVLEWDRIKNVLEACEFLQLADLKGQCDQYIQKYLNTNNCIQWYKDADKFNLNETKVKAKKIIISRFVEVSKSTEFMELSHVEVIAFIQEEHVDVSMDRKLEAVINWLMFEKESRQEHFDDILVHIDLKHCSTAYLKYVVEHHEEDLLTSLPIYKKFAKVVMLSTPSSLPRDVKSSLILIAGDGGKDCWKLDWMNKWSNLCELPDDFRSICKIPDGFVVFGGIKGYVYNIHAKRWTKTQSLSSKVYNAQATCILNTVYAVGGFGERCDTLEGLDLQTLKWSLLPKMSQKDQLPLVASAGNILFTVLHTIPENDCYKTPGGDVPMHSYDPFQDKWTTQTALPSSASNTLGCSMIGTEGHLYLLGGMKKHCLQYTLGTNSWTILSKSALSSGHTFGSGAMRGDEIYLTGGAEKPLSASPKVMDCIDVFSILEDSWSVSELALPRAMKSHKIFWV